MLIISALHFAQLEHYTIKLMTLSLAWEIYKSSLIYWLSLDTVCFCFFLLYFSFFIMSLCLHVLKLSVHVTPLYNFDLNI